MKVKIKDRDKLLKFKRKMLMLRIKRIKKMIMNRVKTKIVMISTGRIQTKMKKMKMQLFK